jgi:asparagine synthase (glutamine-hydrolysing)
VCGITGIFTKSEEAKTYLEAARNSIASLHHRGPDSNGTSLGLHACIGQTRLSIIDTSPASDQPFYSPDKRYAMVFNGEIFNFRELRDGLQKKGVSFHTTGDTEVLLQLYLNEGTASLEKLNGFFAFAVYDNLEQSLFIARDRFGIKPLFYSTENGNFFFASEIKALLKYPVSKKIDNDSLFQYLQLNYIPAPHTILESVKKFPAGHFCKITKDNKEPSFSPFCREAYPGEASALSYEDAKTKFYNLLDDAVQKRLIADVPLGTFLSGGLDSSAITAIASLHKPDIMTFTIGYKNEPMFDESKYAEMVSKKLNTQHHTFMLDNNDLFEELFKILDSVDEPFGDSSALPMHILSNKTRQHVKVALSGDGGDELMGGYNKHLAELKMREDFGIPKLLGMMAWPVLKVLPQSRNTHWGNVARKATKFAEGAKLNLQDRYWRWASIATLQQASELLKKKSDPTIFKQRKEAILRLLNDDFNSLLFTDVKLVLQNDMLVKTDVMSMANSLEVRTPLLDYRLVEFLFTLPYTFKIPPDSQKKILRDSVAHLLPQEILTRKKHGFEVPLLKWFQKELRSSIESNWLNDNYIEQQGIFNVEEIKKLKQQLYSSNPQDAVARVWGLIAFQHWYKKHIDN